MRWSVVLGCCGLAGCLSFSADPDDGPLTTIVPASVDFGNVGIGSPSAPATFQVVGLEDGGPLSVSLGAGFAIADDECTDRSLIEGQVCEVSVVYTPSAAGETTDSLEVGAGTATLTGVGIVPGDLVVDPPTVDFGDVEIGESALQVATVTNVGESAVVEIVLSASPEFAIANDACSELEPRAACSADISFAPTAEAVSVGSVSIDGVVDGERVQTAVSLAGVGRLPEQILDILVAGNGSVTSDPAGIECPSASGCRATFPFGTTVTLIPTSAAVDWGGDCADQVDECTLLMDRSRAVGAVFPDNNN